MEGGTSPEDQSPREENFKFTGKAGEYFSIWIVNIALSILTLGVYSAWAKVRTNQYFYGNTYLDGVSFRYLADPKQILKGRVIAFVVFMLYYFATLVSPVAAAIAFFILMLLVPAFIVMSMSFRLRNSSYRNVRYGFEKNFKRAYILFMVPIVLVGLYTYTVGQIAAIQPGTPGIEAEISTLGIHVPALVLVIMAMFPWWDFLVTRFKVNHASYGDADFVFNAQGKHYYGMYLELFLAVFTIGFLVAIAMYATMIGGLMEDIEEGSIVAFLPFAIMLLMMPLYMWIGAYIQTLRTNLIFNNIKVGGHLLRSKLKVGYMTYLYFTNTLAILLSLGLLVPWAKVRTARYKASVTSLMLAGNLEQFASVQLENQSALGEEVGEFFDMDLGL